MKKLLIFCILAIPLATSGAEESAPVNLTLNDAIVNTLSNQKEIQISFFNIKKQAGVLQQSGSPFDPVLNESVTDVISNTIQQNPLLTDLAPHTRFKSNDVIAQSSLQKQTRIG